MPATKHAFPCGHRGYGQFCHRCFQAKDLEEKAEKELDGAVAEGLKARAARLRERTIR